MARVLLVDDDPVTSRITSRVIERAGHRVEAVTSALDALDSMDREPCDLLITDLVMPGLDGRALCERVRARASLRSLPILVTTGVSGGRALDWARTLAGVEVLEKPIRASHLVARVDALTAD